MNNMQGINNRNMQYQGNLYNNNLIQNQQLNQPQPNFNNQIQLSNATFSSNTAQN